jgi:diguanylate cyclase (GGDEF)-like protein
MPNECVASIQGGSHTVGMPRALGRAMFLDMSRSCRLRYAIGGAVMSMLVPAGLLLLRLASGAATSMSGDLILNSLSYGYVTIASVAAVTAFGYYIGCRTDVFRELATTDPLTGLFNRRAIEQQIQLESERAKRYGLPLSLLMIDLDGLKRINDQGGHSAGDRVLRAAATAIRATLRVSDFGGRWGGDEFVVLAPHTSRQAARQLADRVAKRISTREWPSRTATTASIGIVTLERGASEEAMPISTLIDEADRALYAAKAGGRSCVMAS